MTFQPPTACLTPSCSGHAVSAGLCSACAKGTPENPRSRYDNPINRPGRHLYWRARWRKPVVGLHDTTLRRDPICKKCDRYPSTVADHIVAHRGDERLFFDAKNLQGLCEGCHAIKTAGEMATRRMSSTPTGQSTPQGKSGVVNGLVVDEMTALLKGKI